jgi:hypothetical protein
VRHYKKEAERSSINGKITLGAREGYSGKKEYTLNEIIKIIEKIHLEIESSGMAPIPCVVQEGVLNIARKGFSYTEKTYFIFFSWSARYPKISEKKFYDTLLAYSDKLGSKTKQERVYVNFCERETVLKIK